MHETGTKLLESRLTALIEMAPAIRDVGVHREDLQITIEREKIREVLAFLKRTRPAFPCLMDLFAVDYAKFRPAQPERFAVIYNLFSIDDKKRVFLKVWVSERMPEIDSVYDLFKAANWFEREAFDLYGIHFKGHPNLQRILCHQEFVGHPLRKDYPSDKYQRLKTAASPTGF